MKFLVEYEETVRYEEIIELTEEELKETKERIKSYYTEEYIKKQFGSFENFWERNKYHLINPINHLTFNKDNIVETLNFDYSVYEIEV